MWIFGSSGLIKANLKAYFKARSKGLPEDDALEWVIHSRYPMSEEKHKEIEDFSEYKKLNSEEERIKELVFDIWFCECAPPQKGFMPDFELDEKIRFQIDEIYKTMRKKYEY
jgi:hypothetical protein